MDTTTGIALVGGIIVGGGIGFWIVLSILDKKKKRRRAQKNQVDRAFRDHPDHQQSFKKDKAWYQPGEGEEESKPDPRAQKWASGGGEKRWYTPENQPESERDREDSGPRRFARPDGAPGSQYYHPDGNRAAPRRRTDQPYYLQNDDGRNRAQTDDDEPEGWDKYRK